MQIRWLRHDQGQCGIYGQVISVPILVNIMVKHLPRNVDDDYRVNVHIKRKKIHRRRYLQLLVKKSTIKHWLSHLVTTPLSTFYDVSTIDVSFFDKNNVTTRIVDRNDNVYSQAVYPHIDDNCEDIHIEDSLTANFALERV